VRRAAAGPLPCRHICMASSPGSGARGRGAHGRSAAAAPAPCRSVAASKRRSRSARNAPRSALCGCTSSPYSAARPPSAAAGAPARRRAHRRRPTARSLSTLAAGGRPRRARPQHWPCITDSPALSQPKAHATGPPLPASQACPVRCGVQASRRARGSAGGRTGAGPCGACCAQARVEGGGHRQPRRDALLQKVRVRRTDAPQDAVRARRHLPGGARRSSAQLGAVVEALWWFNCVPAVPPACHR